MPKREHEKDLHYYLRKVKKYEKKLKRRCRHDSDNSDLYDEAPQEVESEIVEDHMELSDSISEEINAPPAQTDMLQLDTRPDLEILPEPKDTLPESETTPAETTVPPEVLLALGDLMPEKPKFGPPLNADLGRIWTTILKKGLQRETKQSLMEIKIPENCTLLTAPLLNPEIVANVGSSVINRDKKVEMEQNQLGTGLAILGHALSSLINDKEINKLTLISQLSNASRILTDLHFAQTKSRKNLVFPVLDKKFTNIVKDVERDNYLYGDNLTEKIKALKTCQKSGQAIKKPTTNLTQKQGNLNGPPRYHQQRTTQRFGLKKPQSSYQAKRFNNNQPNQAVVKKQRTLPEKPHVRH